MRNEMNELLLHRTLGANFRNGSTDFLVWAPHAEQVFIVGANDVRIELFQSKKGYWFGKTSILKDGDLYKLEIDGWQLLPDPASVSQPEGVHGFSEILDLENFDWNDQYWTNHPFHKYIIYELHCGTFSDSENFSGIEEHIAHLKELGITAIEIMPVAQFPGKRNWGYDGVFPFAVQNTYGGAKSLQKLVNTCHASDMAVILDVVYNHLGPEGNYLGTFGPYFTEKYKTPWGAAINFDDAHCDEVRRYFIENVLMWFRDFHIDALRLDAVHAIKDFSAVYILREIKQYVDAFCAQTGRKHYLIIECDLNDTRFINELDKGGYGIDAQWTDEFHHALRVASGNERNGYYSDFNGIEHLAKAYTDAYVYDGIYSEHRAKTFGIKAENNPGEQFVVFSQNHDQVGNRMLGERTSSLVSFEMQKLLAAAVIVAPYIPLLFMGEEWGETNPFQYFVSHTDTELAEAVRKGRKDEFKDFNIEGEVPDPMAEETFKNSKLQWQLRDKKPHAIMLKYYQELIGIRKWIPALYVLDRQNVHVEVDKENETLLLHRSYGEEHVICLMNFSSVPRVMATLAYEREWKKVLDSADTLWGGSNDSPEIVNAGHEIVIQSESILIYKN
jgi:maltooligosyltrehalose trehalohydrolase